MNECFSPGSDLPEKHKQVFCIVEYEYKGEKRRYMAVSMRNALGRWMWLYHETDKVIWWYDPFEMLK